MALEVVVTGLDLAFPPDLSAPSRLAGGARPQRGLAARPAGGERPLAPARRTSTRTDSSFLKRVVAVEDARFWVHPGVDPAAVIRAAAAIAARGRATSGASTLTRQTARLLEPRRAPFRRS